MNYSRGRVFWGRGSREKKAERGFWGVGSCRAKTKHRELMTAEERKRAEHWTAVGVLKRERGSWQETDANISGETHGFTCISPIISRSDLPFKGLKVISFFPLLLCSRAVCWAYFESHALFRCFPLGTFCRELVGFWGDESSELYVGFWLLGLSKFFCVRLCPTGDLCMKSCCNKQQAWITCWMLSYSWICSKFLLGRKMGCRFVVHR